MNIEQGSNSAKIGRFEAMQGARNALTGRREEINIRSQQVATQENDFHQVQTFTPEQATAKNKVVATQQKLDREERQLAWDTYTSDTQRLLRLEQDWQADLQLPLIIEQKLGKTGKEQVLHAAQTKKALAEKATQNLEINASQEQVAPEQIKPMVEQLLAQAPEGLLLGSLATLAVWVINRLPNKIWKITAISTVLSLALSACASVAVVPKPELPNQNDPIAGESTGLPDSATVESNPTATIEPSPTATIEPSPTATERVMTSEERVDAFAAGQIEFPTDLSHEQYVNFIEIMNEKYANKPIYVEIVDVNNQPFVFYHDIASNEMITLSGTYEENKNIIEQNVFATYVEIYTEAETGNLQYVNPDTGELVTVPNSSDVDWNRITDKNNLNDGYIDLPTTEINEGWRGQTQLEYFVKVHDHVLIQAVLLDNETITLKRWQGRHFDYDCLSMLIIETNTEGLPIYGKRIFLGQIGSVDLLRENSPEITVLRYQTGNQEEVLIEGNLYYIGLKTDQALVWRENLRGSMDDLENVVNANEAYNATINENVVDQNIILTSQLLVEEN